MENIVKEATMSCGKKLSEIRSTLEQQGLETYKGVHIAGVDLPEDITYFLRPDEFQIGDKFYVKEYFMTLINNRPYCIFEDMGGNIGIARATDLRMGVVEGKTLPFLYIIEKEWNGSKFKCFA